MLFISSSVIISWLEVYVNTFFIFFQKLFQVLFQTLLNIQKCPSNDQIFRCGYLYIIIASLYHINRNPHLFFNYHGIICDMAAILLQLTFKGLYNKRQLKSLGSLDLHNQAEVLAYKVDEALSKCKKELDKDEKARVKADLANLRHCLRKDKPEKMNETEEAALRQAKSQLEASANHLMLLYSAEQTPGDGTDSTL